MDLGENNIFEEEEHIELREGAIDVGRIFEQRLAAVFAQRCALSENIKDFWILSNTRGIGDFEDIALYTETIKSERWLYLIQLKHLTNKNVSINKLENPRGDFSLEKYQRSYEFIKANCGNRESEILHDINIDQVIFVIYTNASVTGIERSRKINILEYKKSRTKLLATGMGQRTGTVYEIKNKDDCNDGFQKDFLQNLFIFADQADANSLEIVLSKQMPCKVDQSVITNFMRYISLWSTGQEGRVKNIPKLRKKTVENILFEYLLQPYLAIPTNSQDEIPDRLQNLLNITFRKFNIIPSNDINKLNQIYWQFVKQTIQNSCELENVDLLDWNALHRLKMEVEMTLPSITRRKNRLNQISLRDIYLTMAEEQRFPLMLKYDEVSHKIIPIILLQFKKIARQRSIILMQTSPNIYFPKSFPLKIFVSLNDLQEIDETLFKENLKNIFIAMQMGEEKTSLFELTQKNYDQKVYKSITPDVFTKLLTRNLVICEKICLPDYYIERKIDIPMLKLDVLNNKNHLFVIHAAEEPLSDLKVANYLNFETYMKELQKYLALKRYFISIKKSMNRRKKLNLGYKFPYKDVNILITAQSDYKFLMTAVSKLYDLLAQTNDTELYKVGVYLLQYHLEKNLLEVQYIIGSLDTIQNNIVMTTFLESDLKMFSNFPINIISSNAGSGKSLFLKSIAAKSSKHEWVNYIDLKSVEKILQNEKSFDMASLVTTHFEDMLKDFCKNLFESLLKNGLVTWFTDAYDEVQGSYLLKWFKTVSESGVRLWITTRPFAQNDLETSLGVISKNLQSFDESQQRLMLSKLRISEDKVVKIINFNSRNSLEQSFMGNPQHLLMLAEIFIKNECLENENKFTLRDLYEKFIKMKLDVYREDPKAILRTIEHLSLTVFYQKRELKTVFDFDYFKEDVENYKSKPLKDNIITEFNEEKPVFIHQTFAEYLAANSLAKKIKKEGRKVTHLIDKLFYPELSPLRFFFNLIVCSDFPLHLSVMNNNKDEVLQIIQENINHTKDLDILGRTALHLAACCGKFYDIFTAENLDGIIVHQLHNKVTVKDDNCLTIQISDIQGNKRDNLDIVDILLRYISPIQRDVYGMNVLDCGLGSGSLAIVDKIFGEGFAERDLIGEESIQFMLLLYYGIRDGLDNILNMYCSKNSQLYKEACCKKDLQREVVKRQLKKKINGKTLLHYATKFMNKVAIRILILSGSCRVDAYTDQYDFYGEESGETSLHIASRNHDSSIAEELIDLGAKLSKKTNNYWRYSPLTIACRNINIAVVKLLLEKGARVNSSSNDSWTPLHYACENNSLSLVQLLIENGANVNFSAENGITPLFVACRNGSDDVIPSLLVHRSKVNTSTASGMSPLHYASQNCSQTSVRGLIQSGADVEKETLEGMTPLLYACQHGNLEIAKVLIQNRANVNRQTGSNSETPLQSSCRIGDLNITKLLIDSGAEVNSTYKGMSLLQHACIRGDRFIAELLIESKADVNAVTDDGVTTLMLTCIGGAETVAKILLEKGLDLDKTSNDGATALHYASGGNNLNLVQLLLHNGANVNLSTSYGATPLLNACRIGSVQIIQLLINNGADINHVNCNRESPLLHAVSEGRIDVVKLLIQNNAIVDSNDQNDLTPLIQACKNDFVTLAEILIDAYADVNAMDKNGMTPLLFACKNNSMILAKLLVDNGANINKESWMIPLQCACKEGSDDVAEFLIISGANVNSVSLDGFTALHYACREGNKFLVELLLNNDADTSVKLDGVTPLQYAAKNSMDDIVEIFRRYDFEDNYPVNDP